MKASKFHTDMLCISGLCIGETCETCFRTSFNFSFLCFLRDEGDRGTEYAMAKIFFAAANFKNASAFGVKRFGVLTQTLKRFT